MPESLVILTEAEVAGLLNELTCEWSGRLFEEFLQHGGRRGLRNGFLSPLNPLEHGVCKLQRGTY